MRLVGYLSSHIQRALVDWLLIIHLEKKYKVCTVPIFMDCFHVLFLPSSSKHSEPFQATITTC